METTETKSRKKNPEGADAPKGRRRKASAPETPDEVDVPLPGNVEHASVFPNLNQPRKEFDAGYISDLARSIFQVGGLIQGVNLTPRRHPTNPKLCHMIVAGECRWRAYALIQETLASGDEARFAALDFTTEVKWWPADEPRDLAALARVGLLRFAMMAATVREMTDAEVDDAAIIENLVRRNIKPIEEARAFQRRLASLAEEHPDDSPARLVERLAARLGLKQAWRITERTDILRLTTELQDAFERGFISPSQATEMSRLSPAHQRVLFETIREGGCKTYAELRRTVAALLESAAQPLTMFTERAPDEPSSADTSTPTGGSFTVFQVHSGNQPLQAVPPRPTMIVASAEDRTRATALEAKIDAVVELLKSGFDGNDVVVLRRVNKVNADITADKLAMIQVALKKMELSLRAAAVVEKAQAAAAAEAMRSVDAAPLAA